MGSNVTEPVLLAALAGYYAQLERRLEAAANTRDPKLRTEIAAAALELFLGACPPELAAELEPRRPALLEAVVEQQAALERAVSKVAQRLERPEFTGPVNEVFSPVRRINCALVAPGSTPIWEYASSAREQFFSDMPLLDSRTLQPADVAGRNLVLYGTPESPLVRELLAEAGWQVTPSFIALGERKFEGEQLALIACRARPSDPTLADLVYTSSQEDIVVGINALHHGPSDFVIGRRTKLGRFQIVTRGSFEREPSGALRTTLAP